MEFNKVQSNNTNFELDKNHFQGEKQENQLYKQFLDRLAKISNDPTLSPEQKLEEIQVVNAAANKCWQQLQAEKWQEQPLKGRTR